MSKITIDGRNRIWFYGNPAGYLQENKALVDPMFQNRELENWLSVKNHFEVEWQQGVFDKLSSGSWSQDENAPPLKSVRIWQLKPESDIMMKFIGYDEVVGKFGEPNPKGYNVVFDGDAGTNDLEEIYDKFNTAHPADYRGHSLSISDVVELYDATGSEFHYVDHFGFKQLSFGEESQDMSMEMQFEETGGKIMPKTAKATPTAAPAQAEIPAANPMQYDVRIYPARTDGALRANASVNINSAFAISKVRVLEGPKGLFVSMPQYKAQNGEWKDICFPCTADSRKDFNNAVLDAYEQKMTQVQTAGQEQDAPAPEQGPTMSM